MTNQELTTLLSTVLGGVLAIIGGFSASYFVQVIHRREERSRRVFEKLEEVFDLSIKINELNLLKSYYKSREITIDFVGLEYKEGSQLTIMEIVDRTRQSYTRIKMLVRIYIPRLKENVLTYYKNLKELQSMIDKSEFEGDEEARNFLIKTRDFTEKITEEFQKSIEEEIIRLS